MRRVEHKVGSSRSRAGIGNAGKGRKAGVPNKATATARELLGQLVEANIPKMSGWLTAIEKEHGPLVAWRCVQDVTEYHVPKLARTEVVGEGGGPVQVTINKLA